jgi:hypothetical protein
LAGPGKAGAAEKQFGISNPLALHLGEAGFPFTVFFKMEIIIKSEYDGYRTETPMRPGGLEEARQRHDRRKLTLRIPGIPQGLR